MSPSKHTTRFAPGHSNPQRRTLVAAAIVGLSLIPATVAAQPDALPDADLPPETPPEPAPPSPAPRPQPGSWGTGGKEETGPYVPSGKTGPLKELDEKEAAEKAEGPPDLPPGGFAYLDTAIGFGDVRVVVQPSGVTEIAPTASFLIGLGYEFGNRDEVGWQVSLRFPVSTGFNDGPGEPFIAEARDPDEFRQIAIGNIELGVKPHFVLERRLRLPIGLALSLPLAQGDLNASVDERADRGIAIVNQAASASRGWEERALFQHKRFGITPSGGVIFRDEVGPGKLELAGETKIEIMISTGGEDPPPEPELAPGEPKGELRAVAVNWVTKISAFFGLFEGKLDPGLKLWLAVGSAADVKGSQDFGGAQLVLEPNVRSRIGFTEENNVGVQFHLGYVIPLGGHLGGADDAAVGGLKIGAGLFF